jgi:hypothetical protein
MRPVSLGRIFGLETTFTPLFWPSYAALAVVAAVLARWLVRLPVSLAIVAGCLSAVLFLLYEWLHQLGHAFAARRVGHPMTGLRFFNLFSGGQYPPDEPALPARLHVRRALGGFWVNVVIGLLWLPLVFKVWPVGREILPPDASLIAWVAGFSAFVNLVILGLGALLPLKIPGGGLNDGATLLHYWLESRVKP